MKLGKILALGCAVAMAPFAMNARDVDVSLDVQDRGPEIDPFIYGQFIEHLGRCIQGGIWAEMLEDRKFYFPITADYDPYKDLLDTEFPVIGASPWEIVGDKDGVSMVTEDSFVGDQTPLIQAGSGIVQHDLGIKKGMSYEGYVWVKAAEGQSKLSISVQEGEDADMRLITAVPVVGDDYMKYGFRFLAKEDAEKVSVEFKVSEGPLFIGTLSMMPGDNVRGMRADTLELLKELDAPVYRWPGGNFTSGYDWRDGIGDRDKRPPRKNPAWTGVEMNDFGTDEFIDFCREIDTEPMIAANTGFGDAYTAAQWVEYCNKGAETIGGSWRVENGNLEPYDVVYWCVGNEMWGAWQLGFMQLAQYVQKHNWVAKEMWAVDDRLQLVGVGDIKQINTEYDPDSAKAGLVWTRGMLEACADNMTMISEHFYRGRLPWTDDEDGPVVEHVKLLKLAIREIAELHRELQAESFRSDGELVPISLDEWNYWHRESEYGELGCVYELRDALGVAEGLHEFYRNTDMIRMANYAQTVNVIGCIKTTRTDAEFATTGVVLKLYRAEFGSIPLKLEDDFGDLDVVAALTECGGYLTLAIVNPLEEASTIQLDLKNAELENGAQQWVITGPSADSFNVPGKPRVVDTTLTEDVDIADGFAVPALSAVLYKVKLK